VEVDTIAETPEASHSHRWLLALVILSLLVNALVIVAMILAFTNDGVRDSIVDSLDVATPADVQEAKDAAAAADAKATEALEQAQGAPTTADLEKIAARLSNVALEISALKTAVTDQKARLAAQCDWARLQQTNAAGTELSNVFLDYEKTVCPS
jgi:hypothetical protein